MQTIIEIRQNTIKNTIKIGVLKESKIMFYSL